MELSKGYWRTSEAEPEQYRRQQQHQHVTTQLHNMGTALQDRGDNLAALTFYNEAISSMITLEQETPRVLREDVERRLDMIELARKTLNVLPESDGPAEDKARARSGDVSRTVGFTQAFRIDEHYDTINDRAVALTFYNMALIHQKMDNKFEALKVFHTVVAMLSEKQPGADVSQFSTTLAFFSALNNIGHIFYSCGKQEYAAEIFSDALQLAQRYDNVLGRLIHPLITPIVRNLAISMNGMGEALETKGMNQAAMDVYRRALAFHQAICAISDAWVRHEFSIVARNLGALYVWEGDNARAMQSFEVSLSILMGGGSFEEVCTCPQVEKLLNSIRLLNVASGKSTAPAPAA